MKSKSATEFLDIIAASDEPDELAEEIISDPVRMREADEKMELFEFIEQLILHWDQEKRPKLIGHDNITADMADRIIYEIQFGPSEQETPGYYELIAALGEFYGAQKKTPTAYKELFAMVYEYALSELVESAIWHQENDFYEPEAR